MKLSYNWLQDFLNLSDLKPLEIANRLTLSSCELEGTWETFAHLDHIHVATILSVENHPNADRLKICNVESIDPRKSIKKLQIVCGARNIRSQMMIALAPIGSKLPKTNIETTKTVQEFWEIGPAKIRGIESQGMICSANELGLEAIVGTEDGIFDIGEYFANLKLKNISIGKETQTRPKCQNGMPLSSLFPLKDFIFEIENKSITHRPDLWSHYGFARELAAIFCRNLHFDPLNFWPKKINLKLRTKEVCVENNTALAYYGLTIGNIQVKPSPLWMQARLLNIGQQPVNNVVDTSNYVMFDIGQPNHAFDSRQIKSNTISIALRDEKHDTNSFTTLDGQERLLPKQCVLIFDGLPLQKQILALGGIMGGLSSKIEGDTRELCLESATFPRANIRRTATKLNLHTEAAQRFEKGQDSAQAKPALYRFAQLLKQSCPQLEVGKMFGKTLVKPKSNRVLLSLDFLHKRLGFAMPLRQVEDILMRLNFQVRTIKTKKDKSKMTMMHFSTASSQTDTILEVQIPTYRSQYDIQIAEDLVEELGRIYGYDNIEPKQPISSLKPLAQNHKRELYKRIRHYLVDGVNFTETYNYSFASPENNRFWPRAAITLQNPAFEHKNELRVRLLPGLLEQAAQNQNRFLEVRLFEMARVYWNQSSLQSKTDCAVMPQEQNRLTLVMIPPIPEKNLSRKEGKEVFFSHLLFFRQKMETLLIEMLKLPLTYGLIDMDNFSQAQDKREWLPLHPGASVAFYSQPKKRKVSREKLNGICNSTTNKKSHSEKGECIGALGLLHPSWEAKFSLNRPTLVADFNLDEIYNAYIQNKDSFSYHPPSIYPHSIFEISLLLPVQKSSYAPVELIEKMNIKEIKKIRYLTEYNGAPLRSEQKSVSYEVICGHDDKTLTGNEIQQILDKVVAMLANAGFSLRS